ncbi:MAG TPA: aminodeoxychorismate synthase component I [Rhizomicrobium sp.]|nr:aminodeoxychorismate synthase component I [Rhizomicrobium sp.]
MLVILDNAGVRQVFQAPKAVIRADTAAQVPGALAALEAARGAWLAGAFSYELGYALEPRLAPLLPAAPGGPLILFGVYDAPSGEAPLPPGRAYAGPLIPEWDEAAYGRRFQAVKEAIAAGDIYQANLSFRARFAFAGNPCALYEQLRSAARAPHCAFLDHDGRQIVSLSPELFFEIKGGVIRARPMKGTAKRGGGDDRAERAALAASAKDRAENLMIVDLIRNDLGRVAVLGSVAVSDMFAVETYPALHTMVSTVTANLRPGCTIADIVRALFPCGSVTGAPKIRAMEILRALETSPRGAYCGAIGCFAPATEKESATARFNVAIRTLTISGNSGTLGIGGGVVQDSGLEAEYAECLLKARFFDAARRPLELIETLRWEKDFVRLDRHLARMDASARLFGLRFDESTARDELAGAVAKEVVSQPLRVRLSLDENGAHRAVAAPLAANPPHWSYVLSPERVDSGDLLLRHKTSSRQMYEQEAARHPGDEVIFCNERGELTEGARSNIFVRRGDTLLTPPVSAGLLPGILRAELLENGKCVEAILSEADLDGEVYLGNSLRGLILAKRI